MKMNVVTLLSRFPKNQLSQVIGKIVETKLPGPFAQASIRAFAKRYRINLAEAEKPVDQYATISDLFTRRLKPGARPIVGPLVHPCDAVISESGISQDGILIQAKGLTYSLETLLADWELAERFKNGLYATYYLCPTDYHRVHAPVAGQVARAIYIPGTLWPVNTWSVQRVRNLFSINERLVTLIETSEFGSVAVIMVGATNVGKMSVAYDRTLVTNRPGSTGTTPTVKRYEPSPRLDVGTELGIFHMGSTVILLFEPGRVRVDPLQMRGPTRVGQALPGLKA